MTKHRIGTQEEWQAERDELLTEEKELTRRGDELARKRRELPWVPVEKDYRFETEDGTKTLADLFDGRSQLLVYHFMFGPSFEAGCPVCSSIADTLAPQVPHLKARDTTLLLASRAPLAKLIAYRKRMGWGIGWVSSGASDFNRDLGFLYTEEELQPFLVGEYLHNFSVDVDRNGYGVTAGVTKGGAAKGAYTAWLTYRDVDADATLGTYADSDLGAGTDYRGFQVGLSYRLRPSLLGRFAYHDFKGSPAKTNAIRRVFLDLIRPF